MLRRVTSEGVMKRILIALLPFAGASLAIAQPYPGAPEPAPAVVGAPTEGVAPRDGGVGEPAAAATVITPTDPNYDSDPDIDGYDAEYDVHYDNVAAQGYDDGYDPNAYTYFESALSPYGQWIDQPMYGRVWVPSSAYVGADFFPYATGGHWSLTDYGWTWLSDWNWGWSPFHYGRWTSIANYGWCWIPGSVWGPAWVSWRSGGGYVGWSPLPPAGVRIGPPGGVRSTWRFTVANQLGAATPNYLPARTVPSIFARTSVITNLKSVTVGSATVRVNAGPTLAPGSGLGSSLPRSLRTVAPGALPQSNIVPRAGVPLSQRPWVQHRATTLDPTYRRPNSIPIGPRTVAPSGSYPIYNPPRTYNPQVTIPSRDAVTPPRPLQYAPQNSYAPRPIYNPPVRTYNPPSYMPPARSYSPPTPIYNPPTRSYNPPSYSPPMRSYSPPSPSYSPPTRSYSPPSYSAPVYRSAPSPAPSMSRPSYSPAPMMRGPAIRR
jgi:hypothetical protein